MSISTSEHPQNSRNTAHSRSNIGIDGGDDDVIGGLGEIKGASRYGVKGLSRAETGFRASHGRGGIVGRAGGGAVASGGFARLIKNSGGGPVVRM